MASLHCDVCSGALLMQADGSGSVCQSCGKIYSPERIREMLALLKPDYRRNLQKGLADLKSIWHGHSDTVQAQAALDLFLDAYQIAPEAEKPSAAESIYQGISDTAAQLTNQELLMPLFYSFHRIQEFLTPENYHQLLDVALSHMSDVILEPVENKILAYHKSPESAKEEVRAADVLHACNDATDMTLKLLNCAVTSKEEVDHEQVICPLFERLDRLSWEAESIVCCRPIPNTKNQYETYPFMPTSSYLTVKNILNRNRSIVSTRETYLKQQIVQCRKERMDAYWREHPEQKDILENKWVELRMEIASLKRKVSLAPQITRMQQLQTQITQLDEKISQLSIFRQKEKTALRESQKILRQEFNQLDQEFNVLESSTYTRIAELEQELDAVRRKLEGLA